MAYSTTIDVINHSTAGGSCSQMFLKIFGNFTGEHLCWSLFLVKLQGWRPATLLKRNTNTGTFVWNLWNLQERLFSQNISDGCFWTATSSFPGELITTKVMSAHKNDDLLDKENYRPIRLLAHMSKVFEKLISTKLMTI